VWCFVFNLLDVHSILICLDLFYSRFNLILILKFYKIINDVSHVMRKVWNNASPPPKKKNREESRICCKNMRKLVFKYARLSGTHHRIKCDNTVLSFLTIPSDYWNTAPCPSSPYFDGIGPLACSHSELTGNRTLAVRPVAISTELSRLLRSAVGNRKLK
jgi:hypothetical protein